MWRLPLINTATSSSKGDDAVLGVVYPATSLALYGCGTVCAAWLTWQLVQYVASDKNIRQVPVIPSDSVMGFTPPFLTAKSDTGRYDAQHIMMRLAKELGGLAQFSYLGRHFLLINDKYVAKYVLERQHGKGFLHRGNPRLFRETVFSMDTNAKWKTRRQAFRHPFNGSTLRGFQDEMKRLSLKLCAVLDSQIDAGNEAVPIDKYFGQLAIDVISNVAFQYDMRALDDSEEFQWVHALVRDLFEYFWVGYTPLADVLLSLRLPMEAFTAYKNSCDGLQVFKTKMLEYVLQLQRNNQLAPNGLAASMIQLLEENDQINSDDIREEIFTLFVAGHETTAHSLSFFFYALARHPHVQRRCLEEIDRWLKQEGSTSNGGVLPHYVEAVLKESMRRYPVAARGVVREVHDKDGFTIPKEVLNQHLKDCEGIKSQGVYYEEDLHIPQNYWMHLYFYSIHNAEENWGADAMDFKPERWLSGGRSATSDVDTQINGNPLSSAAIFAGGGATNAELSFAPFGFGPRNCLGMNLALMEMRITILDLLQRYEFSLADSSMEDEEVAQETVFTTRPKDMLPLRIRKRCSV